MLDQENIWKDRFNETSLEGESWLQPSDDVLENIMAQVEPKPRRRLLIWFWFIGLLLLTALFFMFSGMSSKLIGENQNFEGGALNPNEALSIPVSITGETVLTEESDHSSKAFPSSNSSRTNSSDKPRVAKTIPLATGPEDHLSKRKTIQKQWERA